MSRSAWKLLWERTGADVVLGSRMGSLSSARAGGMPLYKMAANRVLTVIQNYLTGLRLSEYHTGFRAYSSEFLRKVPFEINTNPGLFRPAVRGICNIYPWTLSVLPEIS